MTLSSSAQDLIQALAPLSFAAPTACTYNPLEYAWDCHAQYLERFGQGRKRVLFLGMNPGPWGMAQTGIPFGEIPHVRDWMQLDGSGIGKPTVEHPKRPVEGFHCNRSEVSGRRLWGLFAQKYPQAKDFFSEHFVVNWCPLVWMEETGRNRTPDKLPKAERAPVEAACDAHLAQVIQILQPEFALGVGGFAHKRLEHVCKHQLAPVIASGQLTAPKLGTILHPSPASPAANRGWAEAATKQLKEQGVWE